MRQLKERRQQLDMSQSELAARSGVRQDRLSLAERDLIGLNEWERAKVAEILGIPAPELFSVTGERTLYRAVKQFISLDEKGWLLDVGHDSDLYRQRLEELARKHGVLIQK